MRPEQHPHGIGFPLPLHCINALRLSFPLVFRDQLYKHFETATPGDFESHSTKLINAGSTLDFSKYADSLFEILLVGGLLQPGGTYVDDGAPASPFSLFNASEPPQIAEVKQYIDVLSKLIRRWAPLSLRPHFSIDPILRQLHAIP